MARPSYPNPGPRPHLLRRTLTEGSAVQNVLAPLRGAICMRTVTRGVAALHPWLISQHAFGVHWSLDICSSGKRLKRVRLPPGEGAAKRRVKARTGNGV